MTDGIKQTTEIIATFDGWFPAVINTPNGSRNAWINHEKHAAVWDISSMEYHSNIDWMASPIKRFIDIPRTMVHDESTFTDYVEQLFIADREKNIVQLFFTLADAIQWFNDNSSHFPPLNFN